MNTVDSLKALYVKIGGNSEDVVNITTIPEMIDVITEIIESGSTITINGERVIVL